MNPPSLDYLTVPERTLMETDAIGVATDPSLGVPLTYRDFQGTTFNPATGAHTDTFTDYVLTALRTRVTDREIIAGAGLYQRGDVRFMIPLGSLSIVPEKEDRITDASGNVYELLSWDRDALSVFMVFVARKVTTS